MNLRITISLFTQYCLRNPYLMEKTLIAFESNPKLRPTHWSPVDNPKRAKPYNRTAVLEESATSSDSGGPHLYRRQKEKYEAFFTVFLKLKLLNEVYFKVEGEFEPEYLQGLYRLCDSIAANLEPEFGCINLRSLSGEPQMVRASVPFHDLQSYGLGGFGARTWLGGHLVSLILIQKIHHI